MKQRSTALSDDLPMGEWQKRRSLAVSSQSSGARRRAILTPDDDMPVGEWFSARNSQVNGDGAITGGVGDDRLVGAGGEDQLRPWSGGSMMGPQSARQWEVEDARAAGRTVADAMKGMDAMASAVERRVIGQGPEQPRSTDPVARWAEGQVGRGGYGRVDPSSESRGRVKSQLPPRLRGRFDPKCNKFVWDALAAGGAPAGRMDGGRIPVAEDWGDPSSKIAGYAPVSEAPQPGDVVSNGHHVGVYAPLADGRPGTVSAASPFSHDGGFDGGVVHNDWGFRGDEGRMVTWRATRPRPRK